MIKRLLLSGLVLLTACASWADWAADRDASAGYVTVTTLATAVDEAVPFCVVYLSDMPADFWTAMDAASDTDGKTIRVSSSDGSTQLPCVPLGVNTGTDTGCLIFLDTGSSASTDVDFRIYNGNAALTMPTASGGMGEQAVFASYAGVYFPGMDTRDFTSGGRTLTAVGTPGTAASGYEGITAATYNGTSQYHKYEGTQGVTDWPLTLEALCVLDTSASDVTIFSLGRSSSTSSARILIRSINTARSIFLGGSGSTSFATSSNSLTDGDSGYLVGTRTANTGTSKVYLDASAAGTNATTITSPTFDRLSIGADLGSSASSYTDGNVAVALLSASVRSANYVSTMQNNWAGTMYSAGAWTALDSGITAGSTGWVLFQTAATTSASGTLVDWTSVSNALVDDANYAQAALDGGGDTDSETLKLTNPAYGMTIPTGAPSYTVEFRIKRARSSGGSNEVDDLSVKFIDDTGTLVGDNVGALTTDWPTTAATRDYVATGLTLDGTEFTSAAGVAISATAFNAAGLSDARVLVAWIRVSWTGDDPYASTRGFFALAE